MKRFIRVPIAGSRHCFPNASTIGSTSNSVRAVDVFVDELNLSQRGFDGIVPEATGPAFLPSLRHC